MQYSLLFFWLDAGGNFLRVGGPEPPRKWPVNFEKPTYILIKGGGPRARIRRQPYNDPLVVALAGVHYLTEYEEEV